MAGTVPRRYKTKAALLEWAFERASELSADLQRTKTPGSGRDARNELRSSLTNLLRCADFVMELSEASANLSPATLARDEYVALDVGQLRSNEFLTQDHEFGTLSTWLQSLEVPFSITKTTDTSHELEIGQPGATQRIQITTTAPSFGGVRYWLVCPGLEAVCGGRFLRLYRPINGGLFACRNCHKAGHDSGWRTARDRKVHLPIVHQAA